MRPEAVINIIDNLCGRFVLGLSINHEDDYMRSVCPHSDGRTTCKIWTATKIYRAKIPSHVNGYCVFVDRMLATCPKHSNGRTFAINNDHIQWTTDKSEFIILLDYFSNEAQNWSLYGICYQSFGYNEIELNYRNLVTNKNDMGACWNSFRNRYDVNLKMLLNISDSMVNHLFAAVIHRINKQTWQNVMQSLVCSKLTVIHGLIKFNNFRIPNKVFAHDGSYKIFKETGYVNVGVLNCVNGYCLSIDKTVLSTRGEGHDSIIDALALNLFQQLILGEWENQRQVHGEYLWVVDRPKVDRYLPAKILNKLYSVFEWTKDDGQPHQFFNLLGNLLIDLDQIKPGPIIGDPYHFIIHWIQHGAFNKRYSVMGETALKDLNYCLRCCFLSPITCLLILNDRLTPYEFWEQNSRRIGHIEGGQEQVQIILRCIVWLNNEDDSQVKLLISNKIHSMPQIVIVKQYLSDSFSKIHPHYIYYFYSYYLRLTWSTDPSWFNARQTLTVNNSQIIIPKHSIGITIINYIRKFLSLDESWSRRPYYSTEQFQLSLSDTIEQFENEYFWHCDESKCLWSKKDRKHIKLKKNWVENENYTAWLSLAWKACTEGLEGTYQLEQAHGVWSRSKKKTETNVSVSKRIIDLLVAESRYQFSHVRRIMNKGGNLSIGFLETNKFLEREFKSCDTFIQTENANAITYIEYEKNHFDSKWNEIISLLGWQKKRGLRQNSLRKLRKMIKLTLSEQLNIDSAVIQDIKNECIPSTNSNSLIISELLERGYYFSEF